MNKDVLQPQKYLLAGMLNSKQIANLKDKYETAVMQKGTRCMSGKNGPIHTNQLNTWTYILMNWTSLWFIRINVEYICQCWHLYSCHAKKGRSLSRKNGLVSCHTKWNQMDVMQKWVSWLADKNGPFDHVIVMQKGTRWLSGKNGLFGCHAIIYW